MNTKEWGSKAYKISTSHQNLSTGPHSDMSILNYKIKVCSLVPSVHRTSRKKLMQDSRSLVKVEPWLIISNFLIHGHTKNYPCELNYYHIHCKQTLQLGHNRLYWLEAFMEVQAQNMASETEYYKDTGNCLQVIFWPQIQRVVHCHTAKPELNQ